MMMAIKVRPIKVLKELQDFEPCGRVEGWGCYTMCSPARLKMRAWWR
jgi:hypothetical protein